MVLWASADLFCRCRLLQHFCAYLVLSAPPIIGFRDRRRGLMAGLELGDVLVSGAGGALLGLPIRTAIALF